MTLKRQHDYTLAEVVGVNSTDVEVKAAAIKTSPGGSDGVVPWGVLQSEIDEAGVGDLATLKFSAQETAKTADYGGLVDRRDRRERPTEDEIKYGS